MAQSFTFEDNFQQTVDFSTVGNGEIFIYNNEKSVKLDNNNPNYVVIGTGAVGKRNDSDQIILPDSVLIKTESI